MGRTVDQILTQIGEMGRFQITRLAMFFFIMFPPTFHLLNMFFIGAEGPWKCVDNSTVCKLNGSFVAGDKHYNFRCGINRSEWEYADYEGPKETIISEVNKDKYRYSYFINKILTDTADLFTDIFMKVNAE